MIIQQIRAFHNHTKYRISCTNKKDLGTPKVTVKITKDGKILKIFKNGKKCYIPIQDMITYYTIVDKIPYFNCGYNKTINEYTIKHKIAIRLNETSIRLLYKELGYATNINLCFYPDIKNTNIIKIEPHIIGIEQNIDLLNAIINNTNGYEKAFCYIGIKDDFVYFIQY